jgi:hypothetical protein
MKKILLNRAALLVVAVSLSSCAYDPAYSSVGASYSSGYGDGYGYGGSGFSTSYFVSTGDPYWGYDPYCHSYYDYRRRCYYDPYLYGYYPRGYRPAAVYGVPHPYSWRPGSGHCPPPRVIRDVTVPNYRNREVAYRSSTYDWAKQVRQRPVNSNRVVDQRPARDSQYVRPSTGTRQPQNPGSFFGRPATSSRPESSVSPRQSSPVRGSSTAPSRGSSRPPQAGRLPSSYNTPVTRNAPQNTNRNVRQNPQTRPQPGSAGPVRQAPGPQTRQPAPPPRQAAPQRRTEETRPSRGAPGIRSLGQG